jgi:long-subunit acyl-CoA synthetase (AMP-forming)
VTERILNASYRRVVDKDGHVITDEGVNGEIQIHCQHPMKGYLNNAAATAEAFSEDGWVRSGDVGYLRDGKWYVVDRTKDLIKVRGWQVSPVEIEAVLLEHTSIADAAVIGVAAHDGTGEVPVAFVVKTEDSLQEQSIKEFIGQRLARYKSVDEVVFVDVIPRNATGKILRRVLRDFRGVSPLSTDQAAASAYSNAIKDLEKYQQERCAERNAEHISQLDGSASPQSDGHRTYSRTASLTDASTISHEDLGSPPAEPVVAPQRKRKRAGEPCGPAIVKRRSSRVAGIRIRV